jgi:hypothetical protein
MAERSDAFRRPRECGHASSRPTGLTLKWEALPAFRRKALHTLLPNCSPQYATN